jgi:(1->4)-alpha-D-glucan 1-alpha-D-glucosylmutase
MPTLRIPVATYRLQLNSQFGFKDVRAIIDYLHELGITDLYTSPLLQARRGSLHGYDVTDPSRLNPEIGSEEDFEALVRDLQQYGMGLILDIVPNHMAASSENPWWMDVLEDGPGSAYASYFDIDWHPPRKSLENKVLLPILEAPYAQVVENNKLTLIFKQAGFFIQYYDNALPVSPKAYLRILEHRLGELQQALGPDHPANKELGGILAAVSNLPERKQLPSEMTGERRHQLEAIKERLWNLYNSATEIHQFVDENLRIINGKKGQPASFLLLDRLLAEQAYVLSYWRSINDEINYRRFFTISELVGVRVEDPLVFEATHSVILRLVEKGTVTGLRIDHIDGLRDPLAYLRRLQERLFPNGTTPADQFYTIVEKILSGRESLLKEWPVMGSTGYDFLNIVNGIFLEERGCKDLAEVYNQFLESEIRFEDLAYMKKRQVMETLLSVEMRALGHHVRLLAEQDRYARDLDEADLARALVETTACLPVYRTYVRGFDMTRPERRYVEQAIDAAKRRNPRLASACFDFIRDVLLLRDRVHVLPEQREARLAFVMRWQQFTAPIMAKGFEDSVLYVYNRLISLNEVGGAPDSTGVPVSAFHEFCRNRRKQWPHTLNATSTHDTKRSEDVRARVNVLSEIPAEWKRCLNLWAQWNEPKRLLVDGQSVPDPNEEILLYQTMLGAWPLCSEEIPVFRARLRAYMLKATREAMVHTKWMRPNFKHERALLRFVDAITEGSKKNQFLADFLQFQKKIAFYGALNALAQALIKIASPGVPDFYQGSELWDLRLVDPDNRGPVDFPKRVQLLKEIKEHEKVQSSLDLLTEMLKNWDDGRIKLFLMYRALNFRRLHRDVFLEGNYVPLTVKGSKAENVCAFARSKKASWVLIAVPRLTTKLVPMGQLPLGRKTWGTSAILLPEKAPENWTSVLTGEKIEAHPSKDGNHLALRDIFNSFPAALLSSGMADEYPAH